MAYPTEALMEAADYAGPAGQSRSPRIRPRPRIARSGPASGVLEALSSCDEEGLRRAWIHLSNRFGG